MAVPFCLIHPTVWMDGAEKPGRLLDTLHFLFAIPVHHLGFVLANAGFQAILHHICAVHRKQGFHREAGHILQIIPLELIRVEHFGGQHPGHHGQLPAAGLFAEHPPAEQPDRRDAEAGQPRLGDAQTAVDDGLAGNIRPAGQQLDDHLPAQRHPAQGKQMPAAVGVDVIQQFIRCLFRGNVRRCGFLSMAVQSWQDHIIPLRQSASLPQVVPPGVAAAMDQHDRRHCGITISMKSHSDFAPFAAMHTFYHRNRSLVQRADAPAQNFLRQTAGFVL